MNILGSPCFCFSLFFLPLMGKKNFLCRHIWEFGVVSFWSKCSALQDWCASGARFCPTTQITGMKKFAAQWREASGARERSFALVLSLSLSPVNALIVSRLPTSRLPFVSGVLCCTVWMWPNVRSAVMQRGWMCGGQTPVRNKTTAASLSRAQQD